MFAKQGTLRVNFCQENKEDVMKIKEGCTVSTSDFWYDLTKGGYLDPFVILEDEKDAKRVVKAMDVIREFEESCEEQIEDFSQ